MKFAIADDMHIARKAVEKLVMEWDENSRISCSCDNGEDVILAMETESVDILIADIRMPGLDGLQLAEAVKVKFPSVDIILISGYADFEYARTALHHGVRDYLLKPLKKEELFSVLDKVREGRKEDKRQREKIREAQKCADSFLLLQYLTGGTSAESVLPTELLDHKEGHFFVAQISGKGISHRDITLKLQTICQNYDVLFQDILHGGAGAVFFCGKDSSRAVYHQRIRELKSFARQQEIPLTIGVSGLCEGIKSLKNGYSQSIRALSLRLTDTEESVHLFNSRQGNDIFLKEDLHMISHQLNHQKIREVKEFCLKKLESSGKVSVIQLEQAYQALLGICYTMDKAGGQTGEKRIYRPLWDFENSDLWLDYICSLVSGHQDCEEEEQERDIVEEIRQFLEENYYCEISLNELAATKYFMNPNYLSRLFKARTGMGFSKYLLGLRMKKAEQLLESGDMSINEVSLLVGYTSPSYFIQNFKKYFGRTPGNQKNWTK